MTMTPLMAVQHVRRMRGGSQAQLLRASDSNLYVVKFTNNPQGVKILANDWIVSLLARRLGLPVPEVATVEVSRWLVRSTPDLCFELSCGTVACTEGQHFGSRFAVVPQEGNVVEILPAAFMVRITNLETFIGALIVDKWTCNTDRRQALFVRSAECTSSYSAMFIDQGHCFNAVQWDFPDSPLYGLYGSRDVYMQVTGWDCFEPWLSRAQAMDAQEVWDIAKSTPPTWYDHDKYGLERLVDRLTARQSRLRRLLSDLKRSSVNPFPLWRDASSSYPGCKRAAASLLPTSPNGVLADNS